MASPIYFLYFNMAWYIIVAVVQFIMAKKLTMENIKRLSKSIQILNIFNLALAIWGLTILLDEQFQSWSNNELIRIEIEMEE